MPITENERVSVLCPGGEPKSVNLISVDYETSIPPKTPRRDQEIWIDAAGETTDPLKVATVTEFRVSPDMNRDEINEQAATFIQHLICHSYCMLAKGGKCQRNGRELQEDNFMIPDDPLA